uniref:Uncharacterized protein n=1 Tax=Guillardia theta TaxID=55529 RepID=A0A6U5XWJ6_GUITH|mmetsp:Transcript_19355/g.64056  ORF Transcript_19355/g.64056 Transcript_19355/m.64056 type:complete len:128 (+) Transcript_19355:208-591(+)
MPFQHAKELVVQRLRREQSHMLLRVNRLKTEIVSSCGVDDLRHHLEIKDVIFDIISSLGNGCLSPKKFPLDGSMMTYLHMPVYDHANWDLLCGDTSAVSDTLKRWFQPNRITIYPQALCSQHQALQD